MTILCIYKGSLKKKKEALNYYSVFKTKSLVTQICLPERVKKSIRTEDNKISCRGNGRGGFYAKVTGPDPVVHSMCI